MIQSEASCMKQLKAVVTLIYLSLGVVLNCTVFIILFFGKNRSFFEKLENCLHFEPKNYLFAFAILSIIKLKFLRNKNIYDYLFINYFSYFAETYKIKITCCVF